MPGFGAEGLGRIVHEYTFQQAFADGLVPAFELIDADVRLTDGEEEQYHRLDKQVGDQQTAVWQMHGDELSRASPERFFQTLQAIMIRGAKSPSEYDPTIKRYLVLLYKRAAIAYTARHKLDLADALIRVLVGEANRKVIVFFERIESAESAGDAVELDAATALGRTLRTTTGIRGGSGFEVLLYHSGLGSDARSTALSRFAACKAGVLIACRALDEGLDIPDVDAAILVSSTQSSRQRIQRIGRVLRRGDGKKRPIVVSIHVRGTGDENIIAEDKKLFGSVATIHRTDGLGALKLVQSLCSVEPIGPPPTPGRHRAPPKQHPPLAPRVVRPPGV
jgi:superfamily II DNA or RNA helicase